MKKLVLVLGLVISGSTAKVMSQGMCGNDLNCINTDIQMLSNALTDLTVIEDTINAILKDLQAKGIATEVKLIP